MGLFMLLFQQLISSEENIPMLWYKLAIVILIGMLVGIERERGKKPSSKTFAGVRTYPLISILGFITAFIASFTTYIVYASVFFIFGLLVIISYYFSSRSGGIGGTSEITHFIVYLLGSLVYWNYVLLAGAIAVVVVTFLTFKSEFRALAGKVENEDIFAAIKFAIITIIILPLLPDQTYGPFDVLNPRKIWYMVVLISTISFVGFILFKLIGANKGIFLLSVLGGIASSTATTTSFAGQSKNMPHLSRNLAAGSLLASSIMFPRIWIILAVLNIDFANNLIIPVAVFTVIGLIISRIIWSRKESALPHDLGLQNPFRVMFAIKFGVLFGIILFVSAAANFYFGHEGIYYTSFFAGLADLDAIALSLVDMVEKTIPVNVASNAIIIAFGMNTFVKGLIASTMGTKEMRKYAVWGFTPVLLITIAYLLFVFI